MLDNITKKNIDNCRDVLVGKVPDPKSQIEQITLALIYKFMDDMDRESEELGGKSKFFTGEYEKFSWRKLLDPSLGGKEMLDLYGEALDTLQTNANLPELFRNIFKNAYLPYRDPATLKLFLKHINEFEYSHSEKLGDAFEYLLSVMGSQGDAGQFRTPRHVIDFIAKCLDPKKNETVADPACGTSGFLLSAYKHILEQNTDKRAGDKLTPDERKKLADNFTGYDISPDMVRLSLVNMYLHGFTTPKIFEYDTLSSEDRWNETFDVILANPPFMTPKGGIRPHKKFGVQANKAEVLFTDYIAEHLNKNGRAGIVVPNGIVATTQTAYKQLRKLLVEDSLIAVISLPAGCFNPYSGVKTSILMLDKGLAKKSDNVIFIKINNDGFDLGAQRREIDKNDLPTALEAFTTFKQSIAEGKNFDSEAYNDLCHLVEKEKILANKDVVLSGERYVAGVVSQTTFDLVNLGEIAEVISGQSPESEFYNEKSEGRPFYQGRTDFGEIYLKSPTKWTTKTTKEAFKNDILMSVRAPVGPVNISTENICIGRGLAAIRPNDNVSLFYLFYVLRSLNGKIKGNGGAVFDSISRDQIKELEIPLPPLEIQEQIVTEIEGYQKIIDGAKMVVENYKPTISINPDWALVELGEVCEINPKKSEVRSIAESTLVSFVPMSDINENDISFIPKDKKPISEVIGGYTYFKDNDVLIAKVTPCFENGKAGIAKSLENGIGFGSSEFFVLRASESILPEWIYLNIKSNKFGIEGKKQMSGTSGLQRLPREFIASFQIHLPSISEQTKIVEQMRREKGMVETNKSLISIFEQKIKDKINEVWGVKEV
jgi:type I restriction enzyme M protein